MTQVQTQSIQKSENKDRIIYFFLILGGGILSFLQFHFALLPLGLFLSMTTLIFIGISLHFIISYNDFFVPASLITLSFVLRTFFPGFLLLAGFEPGSTHLQQAWFSNSWFWRQGLVMASLGIYLFLLFFLFPAKPIRINFKKHLSNTIFIRTTFSFFIFGILLLLYYIYINFGAISSSICLMLCTISIAFFRPGDQWPFPIL